MILTHLQQEALLEARAHGGAIGHRAGRMFHRRTLSSLVEKGLLKHKPRALRWELTHSGYFACGEILRKK